MYSYNCMNCAHPACVFRGESDHHYCGNYMMSKPMMSKPYTLKLVLGGTKGEQSVKDMVCACNGDNIDCNSGTDSNDSASDT